MIGGLLLAVHLLGVVIWVGGMVFSLLVLRPSLAVLEPAQRIALHGQVFHRFFRLVWHAMPLVLLTGYGMVFAVYGGFAGAFWTIHVMHLLGLVMAAVFVLIFFGPWKVMRAADALPAKAAAMDRIRKLIQVNMVLGLVIILVAAWGAGMVHFGL
jgi:uncharacterized membrane protein